MVNSYVSILDSFNKQVVYDYKKKILEVLVRKNIFSNWSWEPAIFFWGMKRLVETWIRVQI